ncbi:MAG: ubiquinone biosynthesis regulatory protein kinase UbiB, partial [Burkholderiales bacterium]|nr:ubiquinone biosynthesis regulatory protein kinase UbiB [Burkholderiales bacterium]
QLVLLQKTLLNVEGLGRDLDPDLDLWTTAKPFLERWMDEQVGWRGLVQRLEKQAPHFAHLLPELPRLLYQRLQGPAGRAAEEMLLRALLAQQRHSHRLLQALVFGVLGFVCGVALTQLMLHWRG